MTLCRQTRRRPRRGLAVDVGESDAEARLTEGPGDPETDPLSRAGHKRRASVRFFAHRHTRRNGGAWKFFARGGSPRAQFVFQSPTGGRGALREWLRAIMMSPAGGVNRSARCVDRASRLWSSNERWPVLIVGTLDTKGQELAFVRDLLQARGLETLVIDAGVLAEPAFVPDVDRVEVFRRAGTTVEEVRRKGDRGRGGNLTRRCPRSAPSFVTENFHEGQISIQGIIGLGGSAGTVIGTAAMRALPFGIPKGEAGQHARQRANPPLRRW